MRFFFLTCILLLLGIFAVTDASAPLALSYFGDSFYFAKQQIIWAVIGFVLMIAVAKIDYHIWKKLALPLFLISLILLILVIIPGLGSKLLGARRWISAGPISVQPSEIVKFTLIIYFASLLEKKRKIITYIIPLLAVAGLIMLQPDLGTTIVVITTSFVQLFVAEVPLLPFLGMGMGGGVLGSILIALSSYRRERFMHFIKSLSDPLQDSSYHVKQVLIALGSGGWFGVGLGQSRQKNLFLPESATDSVFAVLAEEVGFVGGTIIILILTYFIYRCIKIAQSAPDKFGVVLASGITAWIAAQMFLNIASMVSLIPLTGVPLPFFSYGGSSLVMILVGIGILLNISTHAKSKR